MKKRIFICWFFLSFLISPLVYSAVKSGSIKILVFVTENIQQRSLNPWRNNINTKDLYFVQTQLAQELVKVGYEVIEPEQIDNFLKLKASFNRQGISQKEWIDLAKKVAADYIILGQAIAVEGPRVVNSKMRSISANFSAKVIKVKENRIVAYLDSSGQSVHLDPISGAKEAFRDCVEKIREEILKTFTK